MRLPRKTAAASSLVIALHFEKQDGDVQILLTRFSHREQVMIGSATAVIAIAVLFQLILFPAIDQRRTTKHQLEMKRNALLEMETLVNEYRLIRQSGDLNLAYLKNRKASFTLFSFIDQLAKQIGVREKVVYMKPSSKRSPDKKGFTISQVKVKLEDLAMEQLVNVLHGIEKSGNGVQITALSLISSGQMRRLTAILETETIIISRQQSGQ